MELTIGGIYNVSEDSVIKYEAESETPGYGVFTLLSGEIYIGSARLHGDKHKIEIKLISLTNKTRFLDWNV